MNARPTRVTAGYVAALAGAFALAVVTAWSSLAGQIDNYAADFFLRLSPPAAAEPRSVILAIDEATLQSTRGRRQLRGALAEALTRVSAAGPAVVAVDLILADEGDAEEDARLEAALKSVPRLVLASDLAAEGKWENPLQRFRTHAAVGHVHADPDLDGVSRRIPLEKAAGTDRRWALALEAFRLTEQAAIVESAKDLQVGSAHIPSRRSDGRPLRVRYRAQPIPRVPLAELNRNPALAARLTGKAVFVGVTAQSEVRDRLMTPYSYESPMPGVEIHAHAFETLAGGRFLTESRLWVALATALAVSAFAGIAFAWLHGFAAYGAAATLLVFAHALPYLCFKQDLIFPFFLTVGTAWLSTVTAASWRHFVVRRQLRTTEAERGRYQQAIHFVAHEMRSPLTAIQGSSELMGRYNLSEEKRREFAKMIHSESRRLASLIQTFLDVERLSAGQMELKREPCSLRDLVEACVARARPLGEQKRVDLSLEQVAEATITGDRELIQYAVYNLLTNAVKYSPPDTRVTVGASIDSGLVRLWVRDQGIGMDDQEVRSIFQKFYRTRGAEKSGEVGTGIGLAIVEQIVTHHGGRIEVASAPGHGSCFTLVMPAAPQAAPETAAQR